MDSLYINNKLNSILRSNNINKLTYDSVRNRIPYIAIYSYNCSIPKGSSTLDIEFYITDYYQLDYYLNRKENFIITINIGQNQSVLRTFRTDVQSGDNVYSISINDLDVGDYWFSIQALDNLNRYSMKLYNEFRIYQEIDYSSNAYTITDEDLTSYNINKNGDYGEYILVSIPSENKDDPYSYLQTYAETYEVDSGKYKCFMADTDGDGYYNFKVQNWFKWTDGDYQSYIKYSDDYNKEAVEQEALNTTRGLRNLINAKIQEGYNKIILPNGYYRTSTQDVIEIVGNNVIIDFNNSTIKSNKLNNPCKNICSLYGYDVHIINGNFEGCVIETDYSEFITEKDPYAKNWYELGHGISILTNSKYSSFENCTVKNITGYGLTSGNANYVTPPNNDWWTWNGYWTLSNKNNWILGDIDKNGQYRECVDRYVYNDYFDISFMNSYPYISINKYLGNQGIHGGSQYFECHMYDENYNYLGYETCMQFRKFWLLSNTKYIKIVILSNVFEYSKGNTTYPLNSLTVIGRIDITNCYFKDIIVENIRCVGATPFGKNCWYDNVQITKSGYAEAHQLLDAEDTWESLQDFTIKNSRFTNGVVNSHILLVSGVNTVIQNSIIEFSQHGRARDTVIRNCNCSYLNFGNDGLFRTGYPRIYNNNFNSGKSSTSFYGEIGSLDYIQENVDKKVIINESNNFIEGEYGSSRNNHIIFKNLILDMSHRTNNQTLLSNYDSCTITNLKSDIINIKANKCIFIDCVITISNYHNTYYYDSKFTDCTFNNCTVINKTNLSDDELFVNCKFVNE